MIVKMLRRMLCSCVAGNINKFPVPSLQQTFDKYLQVLKPIVSEDQLSATSKIVQQFVSSEGEGPKLQNLLSQRATERDNWLSDWWLNVAYLDQRCSVVINSNPGIVLKRQQFRNIDDQLRFAASLTAAMVAYRSIIEDGLLAQDKLGDTPLCMAQYHSLFASCRIPELSRDRIVRFGLSDSRHVVVAFRNQFYSIDVYENVATGSAALVPRSAESIYHQLQWIVSNDGATASIGDTSGSIDTAVGLLTASARDHWAATLPLLLKDPRNAHSLQRIYSAAFLLALDGRSLTESFSETDWSISAAQMLHGNGSRHHSANRFFDKTLQCIVGEDGQLGFNYEHAPAEGPPVASLIDFVVRRCTADVSQYVSASQSPIPAHSSDVSALTPVQFLPFRVDSQMRVAIEKAAQMIDRFERFGSSWIKSHSISPDAFIQVAMQLAYFRVFGRPCSTYESGSLRKFHLGRTDTIRSCSVQSVAFCQATAKAATSATGCSLNWPESFAVSTASHKELLRLFLDAVRAHRNYSTEVVNGRGIDRHLLGLKLTAIENSQPGQPLPDLFTDKSFADAFHFRLSTSQVALQQPSMLCFGAVVHDGYGFCYNPQPESVMFSVSSFRSCPQTDSTQLRDSLIWSLLWLQRLVGDMRGSSSAANPQSTSTSTSNRHAKL